MNTPPEQQFDFWLGGWDCRWGEDGKGTNTVARILDGKIIQEDFVASDLHGISFSSCEPERKLWCQTWIDNQSTYLDFTGRFEDGKMILLRDAVVRGEACKQRMVWHDLQVDRFEWNWERSDDGGETWCVLWQIRYTRISR